MFNPRKPIQATQSDVDKIILIKKRIATDLAIFTWNRDTESLRLFNLYVSQDSILSKIKNI